MSITSWSDAKKVHNFPSLKRHQSAEALIIGGGLTGIISAYLLRHLGPKLILIEEDKIGGHSATEYTTAFITAKIDTDRDSLIDMYGKRNTQMIWESGMAAIEMYEEIIKYEKIDCEFKRVPAVQFPYLDFRKSEFTRIENQAKFHPLKFLHGLTEIIAAAGVHVYQNTKAEEISGTKKLRVKTAKGFTISADKVLVATYDPVETPGNLFAKKGYYKSYVIELELPKNSLPEAIYWDDHNPYYYFRVDKRPKYDRVVLGGADHRSELKLDKKRGFNDLENYFRTILPDVKYKVAKKWAGPILEGSDGLPLIGEYKPSRFVATAFSGNGMTYAMIAAMMFADYVENHKNPWRGLYNPQRPRKIFRYLKKGRDYTQEFFGGAVKNLLTRKK